MQKPTIFVATSDPLLLGELSGLFEQAALRYEFFSTAELFLQNYAIERPGCLVLDMAVPAMGGEVLHRAMRQRQIVLPVILLTSLKEARGALTLLKEGALDFFEKPVDADALLESVKNAMRLDEANRQALLRQREVRQRFEQLTRREREIMSSMLESKSSREISEQLNMSARTVEFHRARLMKKLGASSLVELVRLSITAFGCHCIHKPLYAHRAIPDPVLFPHFLEAQAQQTQTA
jgi:RNA polymerase sigma factor (sigma-70 family)